MYKQPRWFVAVTHQMSSVNTTLVSYINNNKYTMQQIKIKYALKCFRMLQMFQKVGKYFSREDVLQSYCQISSPDLITSL